MNRALVAARVQRERWCAHVLHHRMVWHEAMLWIQDCCHFGRGILNIRDTRRQRGTRTVVSTEQRLPRWQGFKQVARVRANRVVSLVLNSQSGMLHGLGRKVLKVFGVADAAANLEPAVQPAVHLQRRTEQ